MHFLAEESRSNSKLSSREIMNAVLFQFQRSIFIIEGLNISSEIVSFFISSLNF